jgi:hypothetical protein
MIIFSMLIVVPENFQIRELADEEVLKDAELHFE